MRRGEARGEARGGAGAGAVVAVIRLGRDGATGGAHPDSERANIGKVSRLIAGR